MILGLFGVCPLPPRQQSQRRHVPVLRDVTVRRPVYPLIYTANRARCTVAKPQCSARAPHAFAGRETPPCLAVPRRPIQRRAGRQVMPSIPAGALHAPLQPPVIGRQRQAGRRMPRQPSRPYHYGEGLIHRGRAVGDGRRPDPPPRSGPVGMLVH